MKSLIFHKLFPVIYSFYLMFVGYLPSFPTFINHICHSKSVISRCRCLIRAIIFRHPRCAVLNTTSFIPSTIMYLRVCLNIPPHIVQRPSSPLSIIRMLSSSAFGRHIYTLCYDNNITTINNTINMQVCMRPHQPTSHYVA